MAGVSTSTDSSWATVWSDSTGCRSGRGRLVTEGLGAGGQAGVHMSPTAINVRPCGSPAERAGFARQIAGSRA